MTLKPTDFKLLENLVMTPGLPGREVEVADVIQAALPSDICTCNRDNLGNLVAHFPGEGKRVMITAHMDEVGLIVQRILPNGFVKVERLGGVSLRTLPGSRLILWTSKGQIPAQVGAMPQHLDNGKSIELSDIFIDIGASSSEQATEMGVSPGDVLTWDSPLRPITETLISGKALDDRLGCYVLIQLAKQLKAKEQKCDLYLAFNVQEETMLMGGKPVITSIMPDVLIGIDGTFAFDTPDLEGEQSDLQLGRGPAIKWMDAIRGKLAAFVPNRELALNCRQTAKDNNIPLQDEIVTGISTMITPMVFTGMGTTALALSIPIRYHHTPIETADMRDVEHLIRLLKIMVCTCID